MNPLYPSSSPWPVPRSLSPVRKGTLGLDSPAHGTSCSCCHVNDNVKAATAGALAPSVPGRKGKDSATLCSQPGIREQTQKAARRVRSTRQNNGCKTCSPCSYSCGLHSTVQCSTARVRKAQMAASPGANEYFALFGASTIHKVLRTVQAT
jgi:hypothetical protein